MRGARGGRAYTPEPVLPFESSTEKFLSVLYILYIIYYKYNNIIHINALVIYLELLCKGCAFSFP